MTSKQVKAVVSGVFALEWVEAKRKRRSRWEVAYARAMARAAFVRASETMAHADGDESMGYRCEVTHKWRLAAVLQWPPGHPPLTDRQMHAVVASALLDGIYVGDLP